MTSYQYRKSHCGDKMILRPSYLHNGISYTGMTSLYWIRALDPNKNWIMIHINDDPASWHIYIYAYVYITEMKMSSFHEILVTNGAASAKISSKFPCQWCVAWPTRRVKSYRLSDTYMRQYFGHTVTGNSLSPLWCQAITSTYVDFLSAGFPQTYFR